MNKKKRPSPQGIKLPVTPSHYISFRGEKVLCIIAEKTEPRPNKPELWSPTILEQEKNGGFYEVHHNALSGVWRHYSDFVVYEPILDEPAASEKPGASDGSASPPEVSEKPGASDGSASPPEVSDKPGASD